MPKEKSGKTKKEGKKPLEKAGSSKEEVKSKDTQEKPPEKSRKTEQIIRFAETNIDGRQTVRIALRRVRGVSFMFSNAVANIYGFGDKRIGDLSEQELKALEDMITNPGKFNIPEWLYNRRNEPASGLDKHLIASTLEFAKRMDINEMKRLKLYKGIRHGLGLPVRGQRTRSTFRKGKVVGVRKSRGKKGKV